MRRLALCVLAAACSGGGDPAPPDAALRELVVSALARHHTPEGIVDQTVGGVIHGVLARQPDGSFVEGPPGFHEPTGSPPVYRVPVPAGEVYLVLRALGFQYDVIVGAPDRVEADHATFGRPVRDLTFQSLAVTVDGALPWQFGDQLLVTCPALVSRGYVSSGDPPPGAIAIAATAAGWQGVDYRADRGDVAWALQRRLQTVDGVSYHRVVRSLEVGPLGSRDGLPAIEGTMEAPAEAALGLDVPLSELASRLGVAPDALTAWIELEVRPFGAPTPTGVVVWREDLLYAGDLTGDVAASLPYGNPYPAEWPIVLTVHARSEVVDYALPGTPPLMVGPFARSVHTLVAGQVPPAPSIGAPREVRVEGALPSADIVEVPVAPGLSWAPPASGTADGYIVEIHRLDLSGDEEPWTSTYEAVRLYTVATSLRVPPGLLEPGVAHFATVAAVVGAAPGDVDVLARPFGVTGTSALAGALSVRFRPGAAAAARSE